MLPISTKEPVRFTPDYLDAGDNAPVFLLKVPTMRERIALDAAIVAEGCRFPGNAELIAALRAGVEQHVIEADQPALLAIIDAFAELPSTETLAPDLAVKIDGIAKALRPVYPVYAELEGERSRYLSIASLVRVELFLAGTEGDGAPAIERRGGRVTEGSIAALEAAYGAGIIGALGLKILTLSRPDLAQTGNSGSPRSLPSAPATSEAARKRKTAPAGTSSASSTRKTPD